MSDLGQTITFRQLLADCQRIEVPLIQRDYAQGRETEKDVRDDFLKALHGALILQPGDSKLPLNLDFVYGSIDGGEFGSFFPLDGQQRLTTLFILHWYLAWRDGQSTEFEDMMWDGRRSRFTYAVRPSSTEFFDELVRYAPSFTPDEVPSVRELVEDQSWFFMNWRLDPTIQSVLVMLDAIHELFKLSTGLFLRLMVEERPAITFQLLPLKDFGLTDDLYIKMNARGKPLTSFETFKARYEQLLKEIFPNETRVLGGVDVRIAEFFERRVDTLWTDFFWTYKDQKTHTFDDLVMKLLLALARASMDPESVNFDQGTARLRERHLSGTFSLFYGNGWLTHDFASELINLLEAWSRNPGGFAPALPTTLYFDEFAFFKRAIRDPAALDYTQLVQFAALVFYLRQHEGNVQPAQLNEWMRVIRNLAINTDIERPEEYRRCLLGLRKLLLHSAEIIERLSDTDMGSIGFSPQQVREEVLKAKLVLANADWRERIDSAEAHGYFSGQIEFLLDYCGVFAQAEEAPISWDAVVHANLQRSFDGYLRKAQITFIANGLAPVNSNSSAGHLWKRALLTIGDYLLPIGSNYSFLTDPPSNRDGWKRSLRGSGGGTRVHLKTLWDRIDADAELGPQLDEVIASASNLESWRAAIIKYPQVISYCDQQEIRRVWNADTIYLLKKSQMNGTHAELFSYALYLELSSVSSGVPRHELAPLKLQRYESVSMTALEPHIVLGFDRSGRRLSFAIESAKDQFLIHTSADALSELPEVKVVLCDQAAFLKEGGKLTRKVPRVEIYVALEKIVQSLRCLPE